MDIHSSIPKIKDTNANNPNITEIKKVTKNETAFFFKEVAEEEIFKLLKNIYVKKSTEDKLPPKLLKCAASYIYKSFSLIIDQSLKISTFPSNAKRAVVTPLDKGSLDKNNVNNFRPVTVLNCFSKIFKNVMKGQFMPFIENHLSIFLSAYRSSYSSQHVLIRLIEEWRQKLNSDHFVGTVLMDLSKAFDCIPHDLPIAKLTVYGLKDEALAYILSFLSGQKQSVKINNCYSIFQLILSGVPQESILGPILFDIFINDLILFIKQAYLHNQVDDNTITYFSKSLSYLKTTLENESAEAINWLKQNNILVNPKSFISVEKNGTYYIRYEFEH